MFSQTTWCVLAPSLAKRGAGAVLFADGGFLGVGAGLDAVNSLRNFVAFAGRHCLA